MNIRPEFSVDRFAIELIIQAAFQNHPFSVHNEHHIVNHLRQSEALPVSLVAELSDQLIGYIAFSSVTITPDDRQSWYLLSPLAVHPDHQKQKIGALLVKEGLQAISQLGGSGVIVVSDPEFFSCMGFKPCPGLHARSVPSECVFAYSFAGDRPEGTVSFHNAFDTHQMTKSWDVIFGET